MSETPAPTLTLAGRLWRGYLQRYAPQLLLALAAMAVYAASASLIPAGVEWINKALSGQGAPIPGDVLAWGPVLVVGLGLVNALSQYLQARLSAAAALAALRDLQDEMFRKLLVVDDAQLRALGQGQAIGRLTNDATVLRETLTRATTAVRDVLTFTGLCAMMIWYDWALFVIVAAVYAVIGWPVARIGRYLRKSSREAQAQTGEIASIAGEAVGGGRMIRTYRLEAQEGARGRAAFDRRLKVLQRMAHLRALNEPFIFFVGSVALAIVIAAVALRIEAGALDATEFIAFIVALLLLSQPARGLSTLNAVMQEGFGAFERMLEVIDLKPRIADRADAAPLALKGGAVSFRDVRFSYGDGVAALDGFSLEVPAGATVALVGESGAGKSTVFALLPRLYEPQSGAILIDGADIAGVTLASLRAAIAVVSQETILFNDTVAANIGFGKPGASDAEIVQAATAAAADDFIRALPNGYRTFVGEGGQNLSGGQRQRIAIARAFLKEAPILLLDEATSALDAESESLVQAALKRLAKGRTTLVIAHRLSTVREADLIAVVDKGRVVETGTHAALTSKSGAYARVVEMQLQRTA
ncbi:MAG: ATP-binding cassette domain-containing protein [Parvularculaceae bacterium]|nr:ATP-binding cassette domain-containing protein [Parvularculaceae bacterium]